MALDVFADPYYNIHMPANDTAETASSLRLHAAGHRTHAANLRHKSAEMLAKAAKLDADAAAFDYKALKMEAGIK